MKHFYTSTYVTKVMFILCLVFSTLSNAQNIQFTFENALLTNDGSNDYYEADIMIQTIDGQSDFKLGSGQIYFNYNTAAFGENVEGNNKVEVTYPNDEGYICGQYVDAAAASIYGNFILNDNTTSRFSWAFSQTFSSSTFAANNVTSIPTKLCHIKIEYQDAGQEAMVEFENDNNVLDQATDQFYTACGSVGGSNGPFDTADCVDHGGTQFVGAIFENSGAVLSVQENLLALSEITIYPNPTNGLVKIDAPFLIKKIEVYSQSGKKIGNYNNRSQIDLTNCSSGIYIMKIISKDYVYYKKIYLR